MPPPPRPICSEGATMTEIDTHLRAVARGDRAAFDQLYRTMQRPMLAYAVGLLAGDRAAAEDAVDEAFVDVWRSAGSFSGSGSGTGWVRRIVRNKAVDWLRKAGSARHSEWVPQADDRHDDTPGPEAQAVALDSAGWLHQSMQRLNLEQREAVLLCYFEGCSVAEIAAIMACPEGTVKTRLFHARQTLRQLLPAELA